MVRCPAMYDYFFLVLAKKYACFKTILLVHRQRKIHIKYPIFYDYVAKYLEWNCMGNGQSMGHPFTVKMCTIIKPKCIYNNVRIEWYESM